MVNPISSSHASNTGQVAHPAVPPLPRPPARTQNSGELSPDTVTLKSAGDVDHDGDSK